MKNFTSNEMSFSSSLNQILWSDFDSDLNSSVSQSNFSMLDMLQLRKKSINVINETKIVKARLQTRINALLTRMTTLKREIKISSDVYNFLNNKVDEIEIRIDMQKINRVSSTFFFFTQFSTFVFVSDQNFHAIFSRRQDLFSLFHHWRQEMLRFLFFFSFVRQKSFEFFFEKFFASLSISASLFFFSMSSLIFFLDSFASSSLSESNSMTSSLFFFQLLTTRQQTKTSFVTINRNVDSFDKIRLRFRALHSRFLSFIDQLLTNWDIMLIKIASN